MTMLQGSPMTMLQGSPMTMVTSRDGLCHETLEGQPEACIPQHPGLITIYTLMTRLSGVHNSGGMGAMAWLLLDKPSPLRMQGAHWTLIKMLRT